MKGSFALLVGAMFDGYRSTGRTLVEIVDGRIGRVQNTDRPASGDLDVTDFGPSSFLLPGLVDCHTHLVFDAGDDPVGALTHLDDDQLLKRMRVAAGTAVRAGITTVRDLGDRNFLSLRLAAEIADVPTSGPEILAAGPPITTPGGHCHFLGGEASGAGELRAAVRERYERGCSVVKVMAGGGHVTPGSSPYVSQYSLDDLRLVVDEAHRFGLPVAAHAHSSAAIAAALHAGVDMLEHATFMSPHGVDAPPGLLGEIAASDTFVDPTVGVLPIEGHPDVAQFASAFEPLVDVYRNLFAMGAQIVAGSDAGVSPVKPHDVLALSAAHVARFGMSPAQVLSSVTSLAALACGVLGPKGRIQPGADADLLIVEGNPADDIGRLRDVRAVFRAGRRVDLNGS